MDFGLHLGTRGAAGNPEGLKALAQAADRLGYAYLGFSDHIVFTRQSGSQYPYSPDGRHPVIGTGYCLDQIGCMTFAAAVTSRIRLLSSVMVVPHRPPLQTAKALATVDVLSNGRVTVGAGVGWLAEEMAALGSPPYEHRGAASNEYIEAFRKLWTEADPRYDGRFVQVRDVVFEPKPAQKGGIPIWIGGEGKAARRRAGRLGDGWYPTIRNPNEPLDAPEKLAASLADVKREAEAAGRDPTKLDVAMFAPGLSIGKAASKDAKRVSFTGTREEIAADARGYAAAGVNHLLIGFESSDVAQSLDIIEAFMRDVAPLTK